MRQGFGDRLPDWIIIQPLLDIELMTVFNESVDEGEASAIALAVETPNSMVIVDDRKGRNLARRMGLDFMGTLGLLLKAKGFNIIPKIQPYIKQIPQTNFRLTEDIVDYALKQVGE